MQVCGDTIALQANHDSRRRLLGALVAAAVALVALVLPAQALAHHANTDITCSEVTINYIAFSSKANNTTNYEVQVDPGTSNEVIHTGQHMFDGRNGTGVVSLGLSEGAHHVKVYGWWNTNGHYRARHLLGQANLECGEPPPHGDCTIVGTEADDILVGDLIGPFADVICGLAGDDFIEGLLLDDDLRGMEGLDTLNGGPGNDKLDGGTDDDTLDGGDGNDKLLGGDGDDSIDDNVGDDFIRGGDGEDTINDNAGNNKIYGGAATDSISTGDGRDKIRGGDGDDSISSGGGDDRVAGGRGADFIDGGPGNDRLWAGGGDDVVFDPDGKQ